MKKLMTLLPCVVVAACSGDPASTSIDSVGPPAAGAAETFQVGLRLGDTGPAVQQLNETLSQRGYFPNAELRGAYADWTPVIPREPGAMDRFDEVTERGVREYQARMRLEPTGVVDEATAKALSAPGCGFPEYGHRDESWKFAVLPAVWKRMPATWRLIGGRPANFSDAAFEAQMNTAFREWVNHSGLTSFRRVMSGVADILITFGELNPGGSEPAGGAAARAKPDIDTAKQEIYSGHINFSSKRNWVDPNATNFTNFPSVALHEIGHLLGLHHSDPPDMCTAPGECWEGPVMWYLDNRVTLLREDDILAIHSRYPGYYSSVQARSVVSGDGHSAWFLGMNAAPKGFQIFKWTPQRGFETVASQGAVSIGVESNGVAWAVDNTGQIYFNSFMGWLPMGAARYGQVAAGLDQIWALGKTRDANNEADVYRFDGFDFQLVSGLKATHIAVDPRGRAWILRKNRDVHRRDGSAWTKLPVPAPAMAANLKAGANGAIFVNAPTGSVWKTYVWNQNQGFTPTRPEDQHIEIPGVAQWLMVPGAAPTHDDPASSTYEVTAGGDGRFWAITAHAGQQNRVWFSVR